MITDWELWACATYLRKQHGDGAKAAALQRSAELEAAGEQRGAAVFRRIAQLVDELAAEKATGPVN